jgi:hypothetical protein
MINRIVPMASPFSPYVRRGEQLWMLKKIALAALAPVYHEASQVIVALKAGVADRIYRLDEVIALELGKYRNRYRREKSAFTVQPVGGTGRRLERNGLDPCS